jgi:DNA-binding response OmpR family regulator
MMVTLMCLGNDPYRIFLCDYLSNDPTYRIDSDHIPPQNPIPPQALILAIIQSNDDFVRLTQWIDQRAPDYLGIMALCDKALNLHDARMGIIPLPTHPLDLIHQIVSYIESTDGNDRELPLSSLSTHILYPKQRLLWIRETGERITLTERETEFLSFLQQHKNPVPKSELLAHVWRYHPEVDSHAVETLLYRLRQKSGCIIQANEQGYYLV